MTYYATLKRFDQLSIQVNYHVFYFSLFPPPKKKIKNPTKKKMFIYSERFQQFSSLAFIWVEEISENASIPQHLQLHLFSSSPISIPPFLFIFLCLFTSPPLLLAFFPSPRVSKKKKRECGLDDLKFSRRPGNKRKVFVTTERHPFRPQISSHQFYREGSLTRRIETRKDGDDNKTFFFKKNNKKN